MSDDVLAQVPVGEFHLPAKPLFVKRPPSAPRWRWRYTLTSGQFACNSADYRFASATPPHRRTRASTAKSASSRPRRTPCGHLVFGNIQQYI